MSSSIQSAAGHVATSTTATTATPAMLPLRDGSIPLHDLVDLYMAHYAGRDTARVQADWQVPQVIAGGGLRLLAAGTYESAREVLPDNSVQIPSVTKFDLGARYETKSSAGTTWTLRAGIDNVFDRRAWRESPYQFSHAYLFPLEPRTLRVSLQADL